MPRRILTIFTQHIFNPQQKPHPGSGPPLPLLGESTYLLLYPSCYRINYAVADSNIGLNAEVELNYQVAGPESGWPRRSWIVTHY